MLQQIIRESKLWFKKNTSRSTKCARRTEKEHAHTPRERNDESKEKLNGRSKRIVWISKPQKRERDTHAKPQLTQTQHSTTMNVFRSVSFFVLMQQTTFYALFSRTNRCFFFSVSSSMQYILSTPFHEFPFVWLSDRSFSLSVTASQNLSLSLSFGCVRPQSSVFSHFFHMQEMRIHLIPHERWLSFIFDNASKIL